MSRDVGSPQIRKAYAFLKQIEAEGAVFSRKDLQVASGWSEQTTRANISKKLNSLLERADGGYKVTGVKDMTEDAFCRLCSQNVTLANDPQRPRLAPKVEGLVTKSREAALAAVQHYNNPTALFRSDSYTVLMVIAYTAFFHAVFERDGVDYIVYDEKSGLAKTVAGEVMLWDAAKSAKYYGEHYKHKYEQGWTVAMVKNIEFILPIRHIIEHRYMPQLDADIAGHCQAMLFNLESMMTKEFTNYYSMSNSLSLALQFSTARSQNTVDVLRRFQSAEYQALKTYIAEFQAGLPDELLSNPAFSFRVWLIPKPANRANSSDLAIEFIKIEDPSQLNALEKAIVAIKSSIKRETIDPSIECTLWRKEVVSLIQARIGKEIQFGDGTRVLTGPRINEVVTSHQIASPSAMYYRPQKEGSRAMYGHTFVDWIVERYNEDPQFFYKAQYHSKDGPL